MSRSLDTDGLCRLLTRHGADPEAWTGNPSHVDRERAVRACAACPVRALCLDRAMSTESGPRQYRAGVFGGLDERQRAALERRTKRVAA